MEKLVLFGIHFLPSSHYFYQFCVTFYNVCCDGSPYRSVFCRFFYGADKLFYLTFP